jgi:hypothetical protein
MVMLRRDQPIRRPAWNQGSGFLFESVPELALRAVSSGLSARDQVTGAVQATAKDWHAQHDFPSLL